MPASNTYRDHCRKAARHLSRHDPVMKTLVTGLGPCTLEPGGDPFVILVRSVISQMISTRAAQSIYARLETTVGSPGVLPSSVRDLGEERLRSVGLSRTKAAAILDLAARGLDGRLPFDGLANLTDEEIVTRLTEIRGIGVWTAEMFLIFGLGRLDVLPVGDFGLRAGVQECYQLEDLPGAKKLREIAVPWAPYRSIATWYLWRSRGGVPQSE